MKRALCIARISLLLLTPALAVRVGAHGEVQSEPPKDNSRGILLNIVPSGLAGQVHALALRRTDLPGPKLAAMANARIPEQGVDYEFDLQTFIKENGLKQPAGKEGEFAPYQLPMMTIEGEPVRLDVEASPEGMCGERIVVMPLTRLTATELGVVTSKGEHYQLRRPKSFGLEQMSLVNYTLRMKLRTWEVPFVTKPKGISADGKTVFFEMEDNSLRSNRGKPAEVWPELPGLLGVRYPPAELMLAVSEGVHRFADISEVPKEEKSELMQVQVPDPTDDYAMFRRFRLGDKTFIVRFEGPCT